jgi:hypothetical protein
MDIYAVHESTHDIHVAGITYSESRWREAFLRYLDLVWRTSTDSKCALGIRIAGVVLIFHSELSAYLIYGRSNEQAPRTLPSAFLTVNSHPSAVEQGLARFVKSEAITFLLIHFREYDATLQLWKCARRTQFGIGVVNAPHTYSESLLQLGITHNS